MVERLVVEQRQLLVYNITVAELHNYAVGCSEVLVHNADPKCEVEEGSSSQIPGNGSQVGGAPSTTNPIQGLPRTGTRPKT